MTMKAKVLGPLPYAGPDGPQPMVPRGPCRVAPHGDTVTLTWIEGDSEETAVISQDQFEQHVQAGVLVLLS